MFDNIKFILEEFDRGQMAEDELIIDLSNIELNNWLRMSNTWTLG